MKRTLAISDIHGKLDLLEHLLEEVQYSPSSDRLILLGDYIDRGPDSKSVVEKVMQLHEDGAIVLRGNHEEMMVKSLTTGEERAWRNWTERNGGDQTLMSYGFNESDFLVPEDADFKAPQLHSEELDKHLAFIQSLGYYVEEDDVIFVHAGLIPGQEAADTDPYDLVWVRDVFHNGYEGDKTVIFGHTPVKYLRGEDDHTVYFGKNKIIGIDGAAVYGGQLNCLEWPSLRTYAVRSDG